MTGEFREIMSGAAFTLSVDHLLKVWRIQCKLVCFKVVSRINPGCWKWGHQSVLISVKSCLWSAGCSWMVISLRGHLNACYGNTLIKKAACLSWSSVFQKLSIYLLQLEQFWTIWIKVYLSPVLQIYEFEWWGEGSRLVLSEVFCCGVVWLVFFFFPSVKLR